MRKALKWTARELAARLGVREETISRWEHDREPIGPGSDKLLRLMAVELLAENAPAMEPDRRSILVNMRIKPAYARSPRPVKAEKRAIQEEP